MAIITDIKPQRNQKRVNIYLDNKFGFGLDLENFVVLHLKINQELTDEDVVKIIHKAEFQKTLDKLLKFATRRPRSVKEVKDYLKRKKVDTSLHKDLFDRLNSIPLLDDEAFAKWWVEQRSAFSPKSQRILNNELRIKGIDPHIIKQVLSETKIDEVKIATELVLKKMYKWERFDEDVKKQKISAYLASKGFDWNVISDVLKSTE